MPRFSIERNLLLDYRAKEIHLLGKTIRDVLGTTGGVEAQAQAVRDGATMTLDDLMLNLEEKLALFGNKYQFYSHSLSPMGNVLYGYGAC